METRKTSFVEINEKNWLWYKFGYTRNSVLGISIRVPKSLVKWVRGYPKHGDTHITVTAVGFPFGAKCCAINFIQSLSFKMSTANLIKWDAFCLTGDNSKESGRKKLIACSSEPGWPSSPGDSFFLSFIIIYCIVRSVLLANPPFLKVIITLVLIFTPNVLLLYFNQPISEQD